MLCYGWLCDHPQPCPHTNTHVLSGGVYDYIEKGTHVQCLGIKDNSIRCSPSYVASFSSCQMTAILWG